MCASFSWLFCRDLSVLARYGECNFNAEYNELQTTYSELFSAGIYKTFPVFSCLAIKSGIALTYTNSRIEQVWSLAPSEEKILKLSLLYLDFPLLYSIHKNFGTPKSNIYFDIGTRISALLYDRWQTKTASKSRTIERKGTYDKDIASFEAGLIVALGIEMHDRYIIEYKLDFNLTDIYDDEINFFGENIDVITVSIALGFKF